MLTSLDLDVDSPEKVALVLRDAADRFRESQSELSAAWQDKHAGAIWGKLAAILDRAADQADKATSLHFS